LTDIDYNEHMRKMLLVLVFILNLSLSLADTKVWFSPNGGVRQQLIHLIQQTTENIDVAIYSFTSKELALSLIAAEKSGRRVRLIADKRQSKGQGSVITMLSAFVDVKILPLHNSRGIMHHKFMLVGDRYLATGSYNWSVNAERYNNENMMIMTDTNIIREFRKEFKKMWNSEN